MVSINYSAREVCCKIVYYGPGLSGKTTNLQYVHAKVPGNTRGNLISLATEADRTLYFDFLPINIGTINGFQAKFQLYTVPGQVYYNATRKLVLRGCDGIVFVADSQADKMDENIESLENMEDNLREYGYDPAVMPIVIQYNKRDLPGVLSVDELNARLNPSGRHWFEGAAPSGVGVFDTLKMIIKLVLEKAKAGNEATSTPATAPKAAPAPVTQQAPAPPPQQPSPVATHSAPTATAVAEPKVQQEVIPEPQPVQRQEVRQEPAPVEAPASRPFPGQEREVARPYPGTRQEPMQQPSPTVQFDGNADVKTEEPSAQSQPSTGSSPQMAPSIKKRKMQKKRGLFKRMFGIK